MDLPISRCGPTQSRPPNHTLLDIRDSLCTADHLAICAVVCGLRPKSVRFLVVRTHVSELCIGKGRAALSSPTCGHHLLSVAASLREGRRWHAE
jgi:hypothetical protein